MKSRKQEKKMLNYEIPEFCPCDQIHNNVKSLVIGTRSYFKKNGKEFVIVLNSGTTIIKWPRNKFDIRRVKQKISEIQKKCKSTRRN